MITGKSPRTSSSSPQPRHSQHILIPSPAASKKPRLISRRPPASYYPDSLLLVEAAERFTRHVASPAGSTLQDLPPVPNCNGPTTRRPLSVAPHAPDTSKKWHLTSARRPLIDLNNTSTALKRGNASRAPCCRIGMELLARIHMAVKPPRLSTLHHGPSDYLLQSFESKEHCVMLRATTSRLQTYFDGNLHVASPSGAAT